jgi:aldose sugar dehydrogenase
LRVPVLLPTAIFLAALAIAGCDGGEEPETPPATAETGGEPSASAELDFDRPETLATGLEVPWALAFLDERTILLTERPGRVRVVQDGRLREEPAGEVDAVAVGEAGLLGIAAHPDYPEPPHVFLYYTARGGNRLSRFRVTESLRLRDERVLLDGIPAASNHDGGRIAFGPDGLLYVGTGDAGVPQAAADGNTTAGKILRLGPGGGAPADNPFDSPVFSYGHRNVQGLAWDGEGRLYASEHGPSGEGGLCCHDELNLIERGGFYGWPFRAGGARAAQGEPPSRIIDPIAESGADATWAPAGVAVHEPEGGEASLFLANLAGEQLLRFPLRDDGTVGEPQALLTELGRQRALAVGPDGCLYLTTSNRDGRGTPRDGDDRLLRVCPRE